MTSDVAKLSGDVPYEEMMEMNKKLSDQVTHFSEQLQKLLIQNEELRDKIQQKDACQTKLQQQIAEINDQLKEEKLKKQNDHEIQREDHAKEIDCLLNEIREISQYSSWKLPLGGAVGGGSFGAVTALACSCPPVAVVGAAAVGVAIGGGACYGYVYAQNQKRSSYNKLANK